MKKTLAIIAITIVTLAILSSAALFVIAESSLILSFIVFSILGIIALAISDANENYVNA